MIKKKRRSSKRLTSLLLSVLMILSLIPTVAFADVSPVVTEDTDFDVFMNIDSSLGIDSTKFKTKVSDYLDELIGGADKSYRINTSAATIDPTDLTKWEVYDHYDKTWYADKTAWSANYHGGVIPENWYYYSVAEDNYDTNSKTSLPTMLSDKAGTTSTGTTWGKTADLVEHIYSYLKNKKPVMQFYGYSTSNYADFLYYPASVSSTKTVKFDVDASEVLPHSLKYAGFLINAGTTGTGSNKTMDGYVILFQYGPANSSSAATSLIGVYLYKLTDVNVDELHAHGLRDIPESETAGWSLESTSSFNTLYSSSHIELNITSDGLTATIQQLDDNGDLTGNMDYLFGSSTTVQALTNTNFGGFGPYVDYGVTGHNCQTTSSFLYSNLEMSFAEELSGDSELETYQYADYLNDSDQKFFVNLTDSGESYGDTATDIDNAYLSLISADETIVITDEYEGTYLKNSLGDNAKNVYDSNHVTDEHIEDIYSGSDDTEKLAAKVAWLIYHSALGEGGTVTAPSSTAIASLSLFDSAPGEEEDPWEGANQVNQIKKEVILDDGLNIYLNADYSQNVNGLTAIYKVTDPSGNTSTITPTTDSDQNGKSYFTVQNTTAAGDYKVTLSYETDATRTTIIPATATYTVLSDSTAPSASATISGGKAHLTFKNNAGSGSTSYTSALDSYATVINDSSDKPDTPDYSEFKAVPDGLSDSVNISSGLTINSTHYLHMFITDEAGNIGHTSQSFTVTAPTVEFTTPQPNTYTSEAPYEAGSVTFSMAAGTFDLASYKVGYGDSEPITYNHTIGIGDKTEIEYDLPLGVHRLWIVAVDTEGNLSEPINIYLNVKKAQILQGTNEYTLEAGIDKEATLDYTSTSSPILDEGETLGAITYAETSDPNNSISVENDVVTVGNYLGTATITVTAAGNTTHRQATDLITVRVVKPFTVSLATSAYSANSGITIVPTYLDEGDFGVGMNRTLKYREVGTSTWITVPISEWHWGTATTISFRDLKAGTEYEVQLHGQNARTTATKDSDTLTFKTPEESNYGKGIGTVIVKDTVDGDPYYMSIQTGDTVLDSDVITGDGGDVTHDFSDLPDGFYNIVVEHKGEIITKMIEIEDGARVSIEVAFDGTKSTRITMAGDNCPSIVVDELNSLFGDTTNTDNAAGITAADNEILNNGGSALIELVSTGLNESDVPDDIIKINAIKNNQTLATIIDLSLYKTIWKSNEVEGIKSKMNTTSNKLIVAIPLEDMSRNNLTLYRVHGDVAKQLPSATLGGSNKYIWTTDYQFADSTILKKGDLVGAENEFVVFTDDYAILHVNRFSTYAIGYTPVHKSSSKSKTTNSVTPDEADKENVATPRETGVDKWLTTENHIAYMVGDESGYFNPNKNMTRAEAAQMFYNLLLDKDVESTVNFSDVKEGAWYQNAVETLASLNIVSGYNGKYLPNTYITRGEFTAIAMRFATLNGGTASFSDVSETDWAYKYIMSAAGYGWISGYSDGTYKPQILITRAEVVAIVNNMLGRSADKEYVDKNDVNLKQFPDVTNNSYWAYYGIIEATNGHDHNSSNGSEEWIEIK